MNVFKIPDTLATKYHGAGHALAASLNGLLIDIVYLEDVLPDYDGEGEHDLKSAINDARIGPTIRQLQSLGDVHVGMCSCWEFIEL